MDFKKLKNEKGITLIALAVTIVVLLILAGVSINAVFGENGIIKYASSSGEKLQMQAVKEQVETVILDWEMNKKIDQNTTVSDFFKALETAEIIDSAEENVKQEKTEQKDGYTETEYTITTKDGYDINITLKTTEDGKTEITITEVVSNAKALPRVEITSLEATTNSITVKVDVRRQTGKLAYSYRIVGTSEYTDGPETEETEVTITGLKKNTAYEIKVEASNANGSSYDVQGATTGELASGTIKFGDQVWNNGTATITLTTTSSYQIQYQIGALEESGWLTYNQETGITGLRYGQTVYARIFDGTNGSEEASINILDNVAPTAEIEVTTSYNITEGTSVTISAKVTQTDNESGINASNCKYVFNNSVDKLGTDVNNYTDGTFSSTSQNVSKIVSKGTWYLHVLTVDNEENVTETVSNAIIVNQKVTEVSLNKISEEIYTDDTLTLTATAIPENAEVREISWSSSNENAATVDSNGLVTPISSGTVTITATATDGSGKLASCNITIKQTIGEIYSTIQSSTVTTQDKFGNQVVIPGGFRIADDSGSNVKDGIVVEDSEKNQFVWVPVSNINRDGSNKIKVDKDTEVEITLGRYEFDKSTGKETLMQAGENYEELIKVKSKYVELPTYRQTNENNTNTTAKDLKSFIEKTAENKGYYIARYEASYGGGYNEDWEEEEEEFKNIKPLSKVSTTYDASSSAMYYPDISIGTLWNGITQGNAAIACKNMYKDNLYIESDLMNSYAWDTALVYIQAMGNEKYACTNSNSVISNTGLTNDEVCKIFDLSSNLSEWTTEYFMSEDGKITNSIACTISGYSSASVDCASGKTMSYPYWTLFWCGFRPVLYVK